MGIYKKKLTIIGTNGLPSNYGGFETLVEQLVKRLNEDFEIIIYCSRRPKKQKLKSIHNSKLIYLPFRANGWQSFLYDGISIVHSLFISDVLLILGFSGFFAFPLKVFTSKKVIFNIGGIEWKKVRGVQFFGRVEIFFKKLFEKICIYFSDIIIVDNKVIQDYVLTVYGKDSFLAEYGGDHAKYEPISDDLLGEFTFLNNNYDISISRAQTDMNIHIILNAYIKVKSRNLVVVSNWDTSNYGRNLKRKFKDKFSNIFLIDAIYDLKKLNVLRSNSNLYIHSHSLCGTAPSLTEAMFLKLPVICFMVDTNISTTESKSIYFNDTSSLVDIISNLDQERLKQLSEDMFAVSNKRYKWSRISNIYRGLISN